MTEYEIGKHCSFRNNILSQITLESFSVLTVSVTCKPPLVQIIPTIYLSFSKSLHEKKIKSNHLILMIYIKTFVKHFSK